jgi:acetyl-CoA carboxylase biotin carboxyl carrier protein
MMKELADQAAIVKELALLLDRHGLTEIELEDGPVHVRLERIPGVEEIRLPATQVVAAVELEHPMIGEAIEAPFIGIFYRAPKPNEPPFVEVGDIVEEGQTVCLIEANKVFSYITAPFAGRISAIAVENGALLQPGEALMYLDAERVGI